MPCLCVLHLAWILLASQSCVPSASAFLGEYIQGEHTGCEDIFASELQGRYTEKQAFMMNSMDTDERALLQQDRARALAFFGEANVKFSGQKSQLLLWTSCDDIAKFSTEGDMAASRPYRLVRPDEKLHPKLHALRLLSSISSQNDDFPLDEDDSSLDGSEMKAIHITLGTQLTHEEIVDFFAHEHIVKYASGVDCDFVINRALSRRSSFGKNAASTKSTHSMDVR